MKSAAPNATHSQKPKTAAEVAVVMAQMDRLYKTTFADWISDEANVAYICRVKGHLIQHYLQQDLRQGMHALKWMTRGWTVNSTSELILKLFYSYGIDTDDFVERLYLLAGDWKKERTVELLSVLLIGERAQCVARFISKWMQRSDWTRDTLAFLMTCLAKGLRWNVDYSRDFLMELVSEIGLDKISRDNLMRVVGIELGRDELLPRVESMTLNMGLKIHQHLQTFILLFELIVHEKRLDMILMGELNELRMV